MQLNSSVEISQCSEDASSLGVTFDFSVHSSIHMMYPRRKREKGTGTPPSTFNNFRITERLFKDRNAPPRTELAFDFHQIQWDPTEVDGQLRGRWTSGNGEEVPCYRVSLEGLGEVEMGQSRWKGKEKATDQDYAIIIPRIPGELYCTLTIAPCQAHSPV